MNFRQYHYTIIARLIGQLPIHDQCKQVVSEEFGKMFQSDNPRFEFKRFQSMVTRSSEGCGGTGGTSG